VGWTWTPAEPPARTRSVTEHRAAAGAGALYSHPGWAEELPWLVQGITDDAHDMSLFGGAPAGAVLVRWQQLRDAHGCTVIVHARQVHQAGVSVHGCLPDGVHIGPDADGHVTAQRGMMLAVSVADCVPIFLVAPSVRAIALLHGGWRGVAAGILEHGIATLRDGFGAIPAEMRAHFGPAICRACFEVGPEVVSELGLPPTGVTHADPAADDRVFVDLRAVLAARARAAGLPVAGLSTSAFCTRCGDSPFFSHRAGCGERQIAVLAVRGTAP
jgi:polyphenol oxidase